MSKSRSFESMLVGKSRSQSLESMLLRGVKNPNVISNTSSILSVEGGESDDSSSLDSNDYSPNFISQDEQFSGETDKKGEHSESFATLMTLKKGSPKSSIKYGYIYNHMAIRNANGFVPDGLIMPSDQDWKDLEIYLGMSVAESNDTFWRGTNEGAKLSGFASLWEDGTLKSNANFGLSKLSLVPAGYRDGFSGNYGGIIQQAPFWTSTNQSGDNYYTRLVRSSKIDTWRYWSDQNDGFSVRLMADSNTYSNGDQYTDLDGNLYDIVQIGTQLWLQQNWACTKYKNSVSITKAVANGSWTANISGAYCSPNGDDQNVFYQDPSIDYIAYYPFNGNADDESGNNYNLNTNGISYTSDRYGISNNSILFNSSFAPLVDYVKYEPTNEDLRIVSDVSVCIQFKMYNYSPSGQAALVIMTSDGESLATNVLYSIYYSSTGEFRILHEYGAGSNVILSTNNANLNLNQYYSLCVTRNTTDKKYNVYIDGVFIEYINYTNNPEKNSVGNLQNLNIGYDEGAVASQYHHFEGNIDYVKIYNRELTSAEIQQMYNSEKDPPRLDPETDAYTNEVNISEGQPVDALALKNNLVLLNNFIRKDSVFGDLYSKGTQLFVKGTKEIVSKIPIGQPYQPIGYMYTDEIFKFEKGLIVSTDTVLPGGTRLDFGYSNSEDGSSDTILPTGKLSGEGAEAYTPANPAKRYKYCGQHLVSWGQGEEEPLAEDFPYTAYSWGVWSGDSLNTNAGQGNGGETADRPTGSDGDKYFDTQAKILYEKRSGAWIDTNSEYNAGDGYLIALNLTDSNLSGYMVVKSDTSWADPFQLQGDKGEKGDQGDSVTAEFDGDELVMKNATTGSEITRQNVRGAQGIQGDTGASSLIVEIEGGNLAFNFNGSNYSPSVPYQFNVRAYYGITLVTPNAPVTVSELVGCTAQVISTGSVSVIELSSIQAKSGSFKINIPTIFGEASKVFNFSYSQDGESSKTVKILASDGTNLNYSDDELNFSAVEVETDGNVTLLNPTEYRMDLEVKGQPTQNMGVDTTILPTQILYSGTLKLIRISDSFVCDTLTINNLINKLSNNVAFKENYSNLGIQSNGYIYICQRDAAGNYIAEIGTIMQNGRTLVFSQLTTPTSLNVFEFLPSGDLHISIFWDFTTSSFKIIYLDADTKVVKLAENSNPALNQPYVEDPENHIFIGYTFKDSGLLDNSTTWLEAKTPKEAIDYIKRKPANLEELDPTYKAKIDTNETDISQNQISITSNTLHRASKTNPHEVKAKQVDVGYSCRGMVEAGGILSVGMSYDPIAQELTFNSSFFKDLSGYDHIYTLIRPKIWRRDAGYYVDVDGVKDYKLYSEVSDAEKLDRFVITNVPSGTVLFYDICVYEKI